ncbi:MAG: flagellar hook protein FlgE [Spirochaetales bacterium]|nr:flagellar hook protein FlgE [Spirochaetales bacterium]
MMRSLYSGVAGLQNHQIRMDVIGNNIANVNTIGFKKGRVNFQDIISQTLSGAARPNEEVGGVNPKQVGLGMNVASIDTLHIQGSLQTTGVNSDLAIQGNGFFVMREGEKEFYTRAGSFAIDENGVLVNPSNGMRVQGWMTETVNGVDVLNVARDTEDLVIPVGSKDPARATTLVELACNLDKRAAEIEPGVTSEADRLKNTWSLDKKVFDAMGIEHTLRLNMTKVTGEENQWQAEVIVDPQSDQAEVNPIVGITDENGVVNGAANTFTLEFANDGTLARIIDANGNEQNNGLLQMGVTFNLLQAREIDPGAPVTQTMQVNIGTVGSAVDSVTQFAESFSTKAFKQNGFNMGYLESYRIDDSGMITCVYTNGNNRVIGQISMASFTNPGGLEKAGESTYIRSNNSGDADISTAGIAGKGSFVAGALEMSNVDLAEQFTDMIVTQRGFQANSRTITTSDQMLQELLTLKR